ncbi:uncharacterized protein T551_00002, partial [Pneumocystis jirovecii RU7]
MRVALFALSAQVGCALAALLNDAYRPDFEEVRDHDALSASLHNGKQLGAGHLGEPRRLYRRSDDEYDELDARMDHEDDLELRMHLDTSFDKDVAFDAAGLESGHSL